ncbi:DMT family transporter [Pyxidicoccus sp. 3LG]
MCVQVLISAGTYLVGKRAMSELPPLTVVLWRFLLSGSVFVVLLWLLPGRTLPPRNEWKRVLILGLLAGPVNQVFFFYGLAQSTAAHAALLYALTPLGVYLLSLARGHERASVRAMTGIGTAFAGVVVLLLGAGWRRRAGRWWGTCSSSARWRRGWCTRRRASPSSRCMARCGRRRGA